MADNPRTQPARSEPVKARGGARPDTPPSALSGAWQQHRKVAGDVLRRLFRQPTSTLMICLVIGISLALPGSLLALLGNVRHLVDGFDDASRITVFFKLGAEEAQVRSVQKTVTGWDDVAQVDWISREQALEEFRLSSGLGQALDYLGENPLPDTLIITPKDTGDLTSAAEKLLPRLEKLPQVDQVQIDLLWLQRLASLVILGERIALALGAMLALTVLLVTGNTIRLAIENRREEIIVVKLVGGTDGFVRRPFLYSGALYGLGGGLLALALVATLIAFLNEPVRALASLYNARFELAGLGIDGGVLLVLTGIALGWSGAWLAVSRHIREIEPS